MEKSKQKFNIGIDETQRGIWRFSSLLTPIEDQYKLSLGEGSTKGIVLDDGIILKREDQNPTGSLKDRGMAYLISHAFGRGFKNFVLSSSGNAAISALSYCKLANLNLQIFVSRKTNTKKMKKIEELGGKIIITERAVSESARFAKENGFFNLRPSINKFGPEGYKTIAFELALSNGRIDDIFMPVSSGVCLVGLFGGFKEIGETPRLHLCQPSANSPLASLFDKDFISEEKSLATSLVAKSLPLKKRIISAIRESKGTGWVISNKDTIEAEKKLEKVGVSTSYEGALALAAICKARKKGWKLGKTVCLLTGRKY